MTLENVEIYDGLCAQQTHREWGLAEQTFFLNESPYWNGDVKLCLASLHRHRNLLQTMGEPAHSISQT